MEIAGGREAIFLCSHCRQFKTYKLLYFNHALHHATLNVTLSTTFSFLFGFCLTKKMCFCTTETKSLKFKNKVASRSCSLELKPKTISQIKDLFISCQSLKCFFKVSWWHNYSTLYLDTNIYWLRMNQWCQVYLCVINKEGYYKILWGIYLIFRMWKTTSNGLRRFIE